MSYCTSQILDLASSIYQGIGSPSAQSVGYISGWLTNSGSIGELNNKLSTSFYLTGDAPCLTDDGGGFSAEEAAIYLLYYNTSYYEQQSLAVLANGGSFYTTISEGDTRVTRSDMVNVSKQYLALQASSQKTMYVAINQYKRRLSIPAAVDGTCLPAWPSP